MAEAGALDMRKAGPGTRKDPERSATAGRAAVSMIALETSKGDLPLALALGLVLLAVVALLNVAIFAVQRSRFASVLVEMR